MTDDRDNRAVGGTSGAVKGASANAGRWERCVLLVLGMSAAGCSASFKARSPEDYASDTRSLFSSNSGKFEDCFARVREATPDAAGTVGVTFEVVEETGKVEKPTALPESTAPEALQQCVTESIVGLTLDPADERRGKGTLWFEFKG